MYLSLCKGTLISQCHKLIPENLEFVLQVTVFMCAYSIMYAGLFFAESLYFDPGKVIFMILFHCCGGFIELVFSAGFDDR